MSWEYTASRNFVEKDSIGFYKVKYFFLINLYIHSCCSCALWENAHPGGLPLSIYGMLGERVNSSILVCSFWLIVGRYTLYMFWESLYVLLTIIMPRSSVILL